MPPPPELEVGAAIIYTRSEDGTVEGARVQAVHREAAGPPYYTIRLLASGDERQTEATRLRAPGDCGRRPLRGRARAAGDRRAAGGGERAQAGGGGGSRGGRRALEAGAAEERQAQAARRRRGGRRRRARCGAAGRSGRRLRRQAQLAAMQETMRGMTPSSAHAVRPGRLAARRAATGQPPLWG